MAFQLILFLQIVFLTVTINVGQYNRLPTNLQNSIAATDRGTSGFIGDNLRWVYEMNATKKYMFNSNGYTSMKSYYNFTQEPTGANQVSISFMNQYKYYITVESTSQISYSSSESLRAIFQIVPVHGSDIKFNIYYNYTEPLVTPSASDPFTFYTKSRYPNEQLAEFYIYPSTVAESYGGKLTNILPTLERIRNGDYGDKVVAYGTLLSEMTRNNHHLEHELFTLGIFIKEDLGVTNTAFLELPIQVQLIVFGDPIILYYKRNLTTEYPMKYAVADEHTNIFPYVFTYLNSISDTWSITNAGTVADHQLFVQSEFPYDLMDKVSGDKEFLFKFKLEAGEQGFNIFSHTKLPLTTSQTYTPFRFSGYTSSDSSLFYVRKYTTESNVEN